jgi:predicted enzyme related to lactoylglutathione lyase
MTTVDRYLPGTPCWVDLMASDRTAAMGFYGPLLGWDFEVTGADAGSYTMGLVEGRRVAGIGEPMPGQDAGPVAWTTYLATDDADATVARIQGAEGTVLVPPMPIGAEGRIVVAVDPAGGVFGAWEGAAMLGAGVVNQPGTLSWTELHSRNAAAARTFFADVFGYRYTQVGDGETFDYTTFLVGEREVGGIMQMDASFPAEVPSHWLTYFAVDDPDKAVAHAQELGGTVTRQPDDSPYGRIAGVQDPQGARFMLIRPATG